MALLPVMILAFFFCQFLKLARRVALGYCAVNRRALVTL